MPNTFCTECGEPIAADAVFCTECGATLQPQQAQSAPQPQAPIQQKKPLAKGAKIGIACVAVILALAGLYALGTADNRPNTPPDRTGAYTTKRGQNSGGANLEEMLSSGQAVQYERVACMDKGLGCEAMRSIAPRGWRPLGEVGWVIQSGAAPAIVDFAILSPDEKARAGYVNPFSYVQPDQTFGQAVEGQWSGENTCPVKLYQNAETYAQEYFKQYFSLGSVQLVESKPAAGDTAKALEEYRAYLEKTMKEQTAQVNYMMEQQGTFMSFEHFIEAAEVVMRFTLEGVPCKAVAFVTIHSMVTTTQSNLAIIGPMTTQSILWNTGPVGFRYYIAEESEFDKHAPAAEMFFQNLVTNEQWGTVVQQVSAKLFQESMERTAEAAKAMLDSQIQQSKTLIRQSEQNYSRYSGGSEYSSRVMDGWNNVITGQDYFETSDGGYTKLDNSYSYTYSNGSDFVQSNSMLDMPYGWDVVQGRTMIN